MFFKGYVETDGKKCIEKFKNRTDFKTYEQVERLNSFAGILAKETVLIDIDDYEESEILFRIIKEKNLKCRVYKTTRGKHFLFKNSGLDKCRTHCFLAIGINADIKVGKVSSYEVLKVDGVEREIIYDNAENEEADLLPKYLTPVRSNMEFLNMEAGDGRNQSLFNYILTLQSNDFSVEEARETIRNINDYVLNDPLDEREIETILRDDAFKKPIFFKGTTFLFDKFAVFLKNNHHIIKINNQLHLYRDGIYISGQDEIESVMIYHIPQLNRAKRKEVFDYLELLIRDNTPIENANYIAFRNGVYNIENDELLSFSPEFIITNKIEWDYNPSAYNELADHTLDKISCKDEKIRNLLEECIGYTFYRRSEIGKFFMLTGDGSNGKSTYIDLFKTILGEKNIVALELQELGERFKTAEMFGKLANIGDDIGDEFVANTAVLKKLATGDRLNVERKGQNPFDFNNYAKLIFSANSIPRMGKGKDNSALLRRMIIIPFNAIFSDEDEDFDPSIKYKLREQSSVEYLITLAIQGLKRVLKNNRFTISEKVQKELDDFEEANNPLIGFIKDINLDDILYEPTSDVYQKYVEYCISDGLEPLKKINFSRQITKYFKITTKQKKIKGKKLQIFVEE